MPSLNQVILIGYCGTAPELRYTQSQRPVCNFTMATNRYAKKGEKAITDWHRITSWGKQAEFLSEALNAGTLIAVTGSIQYSVTEDNRKFTDIVARDVRLLSSKKADSEESFDTGKDSPGPPAPAKEVFGYDDIPF